MEHTHPQREEADLNWADLVDAWRAQAWERAFPTDAAQASTSVARRGDAEVEHRGNPEQPH